MSRPIARVEHFFVPPRRALAATRAQRRAKGLGATPSIPSSDAYMAALQAKIDSSTAEAKAQLNTLTGSDVSNQTTATGAASAISLSQNGYNPSSDSDNTNLVHAISGGLALAPPPGILLAGAVEGLWTVGHAIAGPLQDALADIGIGFHTGQPPCVSTGQWTIAKAYANNAGSLPRMPSGSFPELAIAALLYAGVKIGECQKTPPASVLIDACVRIWNLAHAGPAQATYVPSFFVDAAGSVSPSLLLQGSQVSVAATTGPNAALYAFAGVKGNIAVAFYTVAAAQPFSDLGNGIDLSNPPTSSRPYWVDKSGKAAWGWPFATDEYAAPLGLTKTEPRIVMVNGGAVIPTARHIYIPLPHGVIRPAPAPGLSPAAGVALAAVGTVAAAAAGGSLYAFFTNQAVGYFWGKVFDQVVGLVKGPFER